MAGSKKPGGTKSSKGGKESGSKRGTKPKAASTTPVSFANDIVPLFRAQDIQCMRGLGVFLIDYSYMSGPDSNHGHAKMVAFMLGPNGSPDRMPLGGPYWSQDSLNLFQSWIDQGCPP